MQCEKFLHGFYNEGFFDFDRNGEAALIAAIVSDRKQSPLVALDIGAHVGDWTAALIARKPDAFVHCFEIVPALAKALGKRVAEYPTVNVCDFGLSSASRHVEVFWNTTHDTTSAIAPRREDPLFRTAKIVSTVCKVDTGDDVVTRLVLPRIDIIKIDVEGHEMDVLFGLQRTLQSPELRPRVIQFEYGETWLPPRHTLQEAYTLLEPLGYVIGRLYPDGVDFKSYAFGDDHFRIGNYVAVPADEPLRRTIMHFPSKSLPS